MQVPCQAKSSEPLARGMPGQAVVLEGFTLNLVTRNHHRSVDGDSTFDKSEPWDGRKKTGEGGDSKKQFCQTSARQRVTPVSHFTTQTWLWSTLITLAHAFSGVVNGFVTLCQ